MQMHSVHEGEEIAERTQRHGRAEAGRGRFGDIDEVRDWHHGYLFGDTVIDNLWSILNAVVGASPIHKMAFAFDGKKVIAGALPGR